MEMPLHTVPVGPSRWSAVANFAVESLRFRLKLDKDGQYRFQGVHFQAPEVQAAYGLMVAQLMAGRTILEILGSLNEMSGLDQTVAAGLREFLLGLQAIVR